MRRRFRFFDEKTVNSHILECLDITCTSSGRGVIAAGDSEGHIVLLGQNMEPIISWEAHKSRVNHIFQPKSHDFLISIGDGMDMRNSNIRAAARKLILANRERIRRELGQEGKTSKHNSSDDLSLQDGKDLGSFSQSEDLGALLKLNFELDGNASALFRGDGQWEAGASESSYNPQYASGAVLKVWYLNRNNALKKAPECVRTINIFSKTGGKSGLGTGSSQASAQSLPEKLITAFTVAEDGSQCAIGCVDGTILLLRGNLFSTAKKSERGFGAGLTAVGLGGNTIKHQILQPPAAPPSLNSSLILSEKKKGEKSSNRYDLDSEAILDLGYTVQPNPNMKRGTDSSREPNSKDMLCLFSSTASKVKCYFPTEIRPLKLGRGWSPDEVGVTLATDMDICDFGCSTLSDSREWVVATPHEVTFFTHEERRRTIALEGKKQKILWYRQYLVVVSEEKKLFGTKTGLSTGQATGIVSTVLTIYDLKNKFIAYSMNFGSTDIPADSTLSLSNYSPPDQPLLRYLLPEWGSLAVLVSTQPKIDVRDGKSGLIVHHSLSFPLNSFYTLVEKDWTYRVDELCGLRLYDLATAVTNGATLGNSASLMDFKADIAKQHGDHLYMKGAFEGAVQQYIQTIGYVEPSYVIRQFLDSQRVHNLIEYLEKLHEFGHATAPHTHLLLSCYTKSRATEKLRQFIRGETPSSRGLIKGQLNFDVRAAITSLRDSGNLTFASWLAEYAGEHALYLSLQLEALEGLSSASEDPDSTFETTLSVLKYMKRLSYPEAFQYLTVHGRTLLKYAPVQTTEMLYNLCVKWVPEAPANGETKDSLAVDESRAIPLSYDQDHCDAPETLLIIFVGNPYYLRMFCSKIIETYDTPSSNKTLSSSFWNAYLEACLKYEAYIPDLKGPVEEVLKDPARKREIEKLRDAAIFNPILRNSRAPVNHASALVMCSRANYLKGVMHFYEKMGMYQLYCSVLIDDAARHRRNGNHSEFLSICKELLTRAPRFVDSLLSGKSEIAARGVNSVSDLDSSLHPSSDAQANEVDAVNIWLQIAQFFARSYLDEQGREAYPDPMNPGRFIYETFPNLTKNSYELKMLRASQDQHITTLLTEWKKLPLPSLSILQVLQVLATCPHLPFSVSKNFLVHELEVEEASAVQKANNTKNLQADIELAEKQIKKLETNITVFQARRCAYCPSPLDLPTIHFLCEGDSNYSTYSNAPKEHSFHFMCVKEVMANRKIDVDGPDALNLECPLCYTRHAKIFEDANAKSKPAVAETYFQDLARSSDGFSVAADFLSKGHF